MLLLLAVASVASPADNQLPAWLAGYWIECSAGGETTETWSDARGGVMLGISKTVSARRTGWELSRIAPSRKGISFFADPSGQTPTEFHAIEKTARRIVFENVGHDFPQRIVYQRNGDVLAAQIEGVVDGKPKIVSWRYILKSLNSTCMD